MKKILFICMAALTMTACSKKQNGTVIERDENIYGYITTVYGNDYVVIHDTNSRGNFATDLQLTPSGSLQLPNITSIIAPSWTIDESSVTKWNGSLPSNKGSATVSGALLTTQYTITHGLSYTPSMILIQPKSANAAVPSWVDNITSTTFRVTFASVPVLGTSNISFNWISYK